MAESTVEKIRVAIFKLFPPRTPEDWKDKSRYEGMWRNLLLFWLDCLCYTLRDWTGREVNQKKQVVHDSGRLLPLTLKIPLGLMRWIEEIARSRQMTIPEATAYAVEYGIQVLDSQKSRDDGEQPLRQIWRDIWRAIWSRS